MIASALPDPSLRFPAAYQVKILDEAPAAEIERIDFVPDTSGPGDDLLVEVGTAAGAWWLGLFHRPARSIPGARTGVYASPHPSRMVVVTGGQVVVVDVDRPEEPEWLDTQGPVSDVREAVDDGVLLLATAWTVTALDVDGVRWCSERLTIDGLRMDEVADGVLAGVADPDDVEPRDFAIVLRDGLLVGGAGLGG